MKDPQEMAAELQRSVDTATADLTAALAEKTVAEIRALGERNLQGFMSAIVQHGGNLSCANHLMLLTITQLMARLATLEAVLVQSGVSTRHELDAAYAASMRAQAAIARSTTRHIATPGEKH